jgi:DNA-binding MarR family transcriptional regulator
MKPGLTRDDTPPGATLTELVLETFRLNGRLLAAGDALTADVGLSSARWQVMGAIDMTGTPLPVAQIARNMGLTRQAVQRIADVLAGDGLVAYADNPNHRRAKLVGLTEQGRAVLQEVSRRQTEWVNRLAAGLAESDLRTAVAILRTVRERLERDERELPPGIPQEDPR